MQVAAAVISKSTERFSSPISPFPKVGCPVQQFVQGMEIVGVDVVVVTVSTDAAVTVAANAENMVGLATMLVAAPVVLDMLATGSLGRL